MNELSIEIQTYASDTTTEKSAQVAIGLAAWLDSFWIPTQRRKYPLINFCLCDTRLCITCDDNCDSWTKLVSATLKKVIVEDLGNMNAVELLKTIPFNDSNSRGLENLQELAKALQVKVVFCENGHVLLVGQKAKLSKKCFTIRNILSHYHWRLSGKEIAFP